MSSYWDGVKRRWNGMLYPQSLPPKKGKGDSDTVSGTGGVTGSGGDPGKEWELVYLKFREIEGRDPYSFQELVDWWNRA